VIYLILNLKIDPMFSKKRLLPYAANLKEKARDLRNQSTPAEKRFWNGLRKMPFYESLTFNRKKPIGNYIVDFYCHRLHLVVEIDGDSHGQTETQLKDIERTRFLQSQGLTVLRFTNSEIDKSLDAVMVEIETFIKKGKSPLPPLKKE
jgi:very-short-patch-repair endonuclease